MDSTVEETITRQRKQALAELREANVRRMEDDAMEKAHAFRVAQRDRDLIKEARQRRIQENKDRAHRLRRHSASVTVHRWCRACRF